MIEERSSGIPKTHRYVHKYMAYMALFLSLSPPLSQFLSSVSLYVLCIEQHQSILYISSPSLPAVHNLLIRPTRRSCSLDQQIPAMISRKNPYPVVLLIQVIYSGMFLLWKVAIDLGMNSFVFAFYRQAFATALLAPLALYFEW